MMPFNAPDWITALISAAVAAASAIFAAIKIGVTPLAERVQVLTQEQAAMKSQLSSLESRTANTEVMAEHNQEIIKDGIQGMRESMRSIKASIDRRDDKFDGRLNTIEERIIALISTINGKHNV